MAGSKAVQRPGWHLTLNPHSSYRVESRSLKPQTKTGSSVLGFYRADIGLKQEAYRAAIGLKQKV